MPLSYIICQLLISSVKRCREDPLGRNSDDDARYISARASVCNESAESNVAVIFRAFECSNASDRSPSENFAREHV